MDSATLLRMSWSLRFAAVRELAVTFHGAYKQQSTSHNGRQTRFVIVGRPTWQSSWQIVSIGTGP